MREEDRASDAFEEDASLGLRSNHVQREDVGTAQAMPVKKMPARVPMMSHQGVVCAARSDALSRMPVQGRTENDTKRRNSMSV